MVAVSPLQITGDEGRGKEALLRSARRSLSKTIEYLREIQGQVVMKLAGVDSISAALRLVGYEVFFKQAGAAVLGHELLGYRVFDEQGRCWGSIVSIADRTANVLAEVRDEKSGETILLPLREELILNVDRQQRILHISPPAGLRELNS